MNQAVKIEPPKTLFAAMAKAFPEIEGAAKDKLNPHFKTKYADLGSVMDAIKPALAKYGLWFRQASILADGGVCIETFICHEGGEELSCGSLFVPASKNDAQGYGSALTYCRRYALQTAFGVPAEDDDGNAAVKSAPGKHAVATITPEQELMIQDKGNEVKQDWPRFLTWAKIAALKDLPADRFEEVMAMLNKKLPKQEANPQHSEELADEIPY